MRIAVVSNRNRPGCPDANLPGHARWVRRAAQASARLVCFPELSLSGYGCRPFMRGIASPLSGPWCGAMVALAREHDVYVAFGMALRLRGRCMLSHVLVGPRGLVGHYEKVHLAGREADVFAPGGEFRVFDVEGACVGVNICFDGRHPGSSLCLAHLGAELILHPHGNTVGGLGADPLDWTASKRAYLGPRAVDTCTYTAICNSVGSVLDRDGRRVEFSGGATVLGPAGEFVARSVAKARREHMVVADLDLASLRGTRAASHFVQRRPDAYVRALSARGGG